MGNSPIDDRLIDDNLFVVTTSLDWYASIVEFLTTQQFPDNWTKEERRKVRIHSRHFAVIGHRLFGGTLMGSWKDVYQRWRFQPF